MRELEEATPGPFLDAHQAALHELLDILLGHPGRAERFVVDHEVSEPSPRQELFLDEGADRLAQVGDAALVEVREDLVLRPVESPLGDLGFAPLEALAIELAADDAQKRGLDFEVHELVVRVRGGDEPDHALGDVRSDDVLRLVDGLESGDAVHPLQAETVVGDRAHLVPERFEVGEKVLAERQEYLVAVPLERELRGLARSLPRRLQLQTSPELKRRPCLDQVRELQEKRVRRLRPRSVACARA